MRGFSQYFLVAAAATGLLTNVVGRTISLTGPGDLGDIRQEIPADGIQKRVVTAPKAPVTAPKGKTQEQCQRCPANKKPSRRGLFSCCSGGAADNFLDNLPADTITTSIVAGSVTKARSDARRLLAAHKQEVTSPPWTNSYGPPQANNFQVGALPQNIHADLAADLGVTIQTNPQHFIVNPIGHAPPRPVLGAYYLPNAIIITDIFKDSDNNPAAHRLHPSELLYQGAQHLPSHPTVIAHHNVVNTATDSFATTALNGATTVTVSPTNNGDAFMSLLGSDNGRPVQRALNDHPNWLGGRNVNSIKVVRRNGGLHLFYYI